MSKADKRKQREKRLKSARGREALRGAAESYFFEGLDCFQDEDFVQAISFFLKALKIDPSFKDAQIYAANSYINLEDYENALKYSISLIHSGKRQVRAMFYVFFSYVHLNRHVEALEFYIDTILPFPREEITHPYDISLRGRIEATARKLIEYYIGRRKEFSPERDAREALRKLREIVAERNKIREFERQTRGGWVRDETKTRKIERESRKKLDDIEKERMKLLKERGKMENAWKAEDEKDAKDEIEAEKLFSIEKREMPSISFRYSFESDGVLEQMERGEFEEQSLYCIRMDSERIMLMRGFDELLCLNALHGVEKYLYQVETVRKVLKYFRGRALLCDEVGLGKTVEAGMILKEYYLRGLAKKILILTPPSLVDQWRVEMEEKFEVSFQTTQDESYSENPEAFWRDGRRVIASIGTAKSRKNFAMVTEIEYDLVIVDEAHHIKNRTTLGWKLVNSLKKKFLLLLTATPVQNDLTELYNLITLLSPGTLSTPAVFRKEFVDRNDPRKPRNMDKLRDLLHTVMIRNTRAMVDIKLPPRYASTYRVEQSPGEKELYGKIDELARMVYSDEFTSRMLSMTLLTAAGSSPRALALTVERMMKNPKYENLGSILAEVLKRCKDLEVTGKSETLLEILGKSNEKTIVFTKYIGTLEYLAEVLGKKKISTAVFHGGFSAVEKEKQIDYFREGASILLTSEVGGEGKNLQFCNTIINFDLPWNPMQIEQRIGRIHRIGQERDVFIFNLAQKGTLEDYILSILDRKINMFELVIGEIGMILGNLDIEKEFPDIVLEIWARSRDSKELEENFDRLGDELIHSKQDYLKTRELDKTLFSEDFEV